MAAGADTIAHATTIAAFGQGIFIRGTSGAGKSSLALQLITLGAELVADDRTILRVKEGGLIAMAPERLRGLIEARGIGLLRRSYCQQAQIGLVIDLDQVETQRLPPQRSTNIQGITLPVLHKVVADAWPAAIYTYLSSHRVDPEAPNVV